MHAFDLERLAGRQLRARRARAGETIRTLDGEDAHARRRACSSSPTRTAPQAVAGVMGGAASEVWSGTRLRRLRERLLQARVGAPHQQAARPEDGGLVALRARHRHQRAGRRPRARLRAARADRRRPPRRRAVIDVYPAPRGPIDDPAPPRPDRPPARHRRRRRRRACASSPGLGFDVAPTARTAGTCAHPDASASTSRARPTSSRRSPATTATTGSRRTFPRAARRSRRGPTRGSRARACCATCSTAAGFSEAVSYTFIAAPTPRRSPRPAQPPVPLAYPLSEKFAVLRPSLLPGLVGRRRPQPAPRQRDVRLFEIGACVLGRPRRAAPAGLRAGPAPARAEHWAGGHRLVDFFDAKGVVERIGEALRLPLTFAAAACAVPRAGPGRVVRRRRRRCSASSASWLPAARGSRATLRRPTTSTSRNSTSTPSTRLVAGRRRAVRGRCPASRRSCATSRSSSDEALPAEQLRGTIRARGARDARHDPRVRPLQGQGHPRGPLQPVAAPDVPIARPDADRRRGAGRRWAVSWRRSSRARGGQR